MTKLRGFQCRLITLRGSENVHAFLISKLGQSFRVHWPTALLSGFQRLSGVASIDDQQQMAGIKAFDRLFQLFVRDAMREYVAQSRFTQFGAVARVAKIVWNQIEALRLRGAMAGEVDDDGILRLGAFEIAERRIAHLQTRRFRRARQPPQGRQNIGFGRALVN